MLRAVAGRGLAWPGPGSLEEAGPLVGSVAELVAKNAEGAGRVGETACGLGGGKSVDEVGTERLVLPLLGSLGSQEELCGLLER
jgi:hypothetical protein